MASVPDDFSVRYRVGLTGEAFAVDAPADRIVQVLPDVFETLGLPGAEASDLGELVFVTPPLRITGLLYEGRRNSEFLDCGRGISAARADEADHALVFFVLTRIQATGPGSSAIESILDGHAENRYHRTDPIPCRGTGELERDIAEIVRVLVR